MTAETLERRVIKAQVMRTPTDGKGTFDFEVHPFEIDLDNERVKNFTNVGPGRRAQVPLDYQHTLEDMDPGGTIGLADVAQKDDALHGTARLQIESNPMAMAVYERLLLPEDDPLRLSEVSIFYAFEPAKAFKGESGELVQTDCELLGLAVVHRGAQRTAIMNVKGAIAAGTVNTTAGTVYIDVIPRLTGPMAEMITQTDWFGDVEADRTARPRHMHREYTDEERAELMAKMALIGARADVLKADRVLSSKNETTLRQAHDLLGQVLESVGDTSAEESQKDEANAEEPSQANAEEPTPDSEPDVRAQWAELLAR